jgi:superoxide reductase
MIKFMVKYMVEVKQIYKCKACGNIVEVLHGGGGELICCEESMKLLEEQTKDAAIEKHVPFIEHTSDGILVKIGQKQDHPMQDEHYIEWIELIADGESYRKYLKPGDKPQALFCITADLAHAREYCNIHGLWKS